MMETSHLLLRRPRETCASGYAMAALLVSLAMMSILMGVLLPVWSQAAQREREAELVFRGEQYARAIELYQRRYVGAFPPDVATLVEQRFLRRQFKDPMTQEGDFQVLYQAQGTDVASAPTGQVGPVGNSGSQQRATSVPQGGVIGVVSKSTEESRRIYNGASRYNEWVFVHLPSTTQLGDGQGRETSEGAAAPREGGGSEPEGRSGRRFDDVSPSGFSGGRRPAPPVGPPGR